MNTYKLKKQLLRPLLALFCITFADAQVTAAKGELLKKGNTWRFDVSLTIPADVNFTPEYNTEGTITNKGTVYRFKEMQQSIGKSTIKDLEAEACKVNIFIDNELKKQQILNFIDGSCNPVSTRWAK